MKREEKFIRGPSPCEHNYFQAQGPRKATRDVSQKDSEKKTKQGSHILEVLLQSSWFLLRVKEQRIEKNRLMGSWGHLFGGRGRSLEKQWKVSSLGPKKEQQYSEGHGGQRVVPGGEPAAYAS